MGGHHHGNRTVLPRSGGKGGGGCWWAAAGCIMRDPTPVREKLRSTEMRTDMLSQPLPQPRVSGARQASHSASLTLRGAMPDRSRCPTKSTACAKIWIPFTHIHGHHKDKLDSHHMDQHQRWKCQARVQGKNMRAFWPPVRVSNCVIICCIIIWCIIISSQEGDAFNVPVGWRMGEL